MSEPDLFKAISHCKEVISKMDNCPCKDDHKELLFFLEELQFRRDLDPELPWEIYEIISRYRTEYFIQNKRNEITKYDFDAFDLLHDEHREFSPKQIFALKCFGVTFVIALIFFLGLIVML